jgi:hypothetical protein
MLLTSLPENGLFIRMVYKPAVTIINIRFAFSRPLKSDDSFSARFTLTKNSVRMSTMVCSGSDAANTPMAIAGRMLTLLPDIDRLYIRLYHFINYLYMNFNASSDNPYNAAD